VIWVSGFGCGDASMPPALSKLSCLLGMHIRCESPAQGLEFRFDAGAQISRREREREIVRCALRAERDSYSGSASLHICVPNSPHMCVPSRHSSLVTTSLQGTPGVLLGLEMKEALVSGAIGSRRRGRGQRQSAFFIGDKVTRMHRTTAHDSQL